jgi:hypothetical protein
MSYEINSKLRESLSEQYGEELLFMDGYDDCIYGIVERFGISAIVCYDKEKVINKMMDDGMSYDEALEYFEYNQLGSYVGDYTPCFLNKIS